MVAGKRLIARKRPILGTLIGCEKGPKERSFKWEIWNTHVKGTFINRYSCGGRNGVASSSHLSDLFKRNSVFKPCLYLQGDLYCQRHRIHENVNP